MCPQMLHPGTWTTPTSPSIALLDGCWLLPGALNEVFPLFSLIPRISGGLGKFWGLGSCLDFSPQHLPRPHPACKCKYQRDEQLLEIIQGQILPKSPSQSWELQAPWPLPTFSPDLGVTNLKWGKNQRNWGWGGVGKLRHGGFAPLLSTRASLELQRAHVDPSLSQLPGAVLGNEPVLGVPSPG